MKSEIKSKSIIETEFPVLMRNIKYGYVVMFQNKCKGTIVLDKNKKELGKSLDGWIQCYDNSVWEKFDGIIELSN